jgi:hypothetical protein
MRMPFARLMELVRKVDGRITLGELSQHWGEPVSRIADAIDANKVVDGQKGYI